MNSRIVLSQKMKIFTHWSKLYSFYFPTIITWKPSFYVFVSGSRTVLSTHISDKAQCLFFCFRIISLNISSLMNHDSDYLLLNLNAYLTPKIMDSMTENKMSVLILLNPEYKNYLWSILCIKSKTFKIAKKGGDSHS